MDETTGIVTDIYPVGVLESLQHAGRCLTKKGLDKRLKRARLCIRREGMMLTYRFKQREWRNLKNHFNGYLAEHQGCHHDAGAAWSKKRALARVERICEMDDYARRAAVFGDPRSF